MPFVALASQSFTVKWHIPPHFPSKQYPSVFPFPFPLSVLPQPRPISPRDMSPSPCDVYVALRRQRVDGFREIGVNMKGVRACLINTVMWQATLKRAVAPRCRRNDVATCSSGSSATTVCNGRALKKEYPSLRIRRPAL